VEARDVKTDEPHFPNQQQLQGIVGIFEPRRQGCYEEALRNRSWQVQPHAKFGLRTHRHLTGTCFVGGGLSDLQADIIQDLLTVRPLWDYRY